MRVLRETFLCTFEAAIREARRAQRHAVLQRDRRRAVAREPLAARDVLRGEWGFRGFVVSDYFAIRELDDRPETHGHHVAADAKEAAALAVRAGVNIELPEPDCYPHLVELVRDGTIPEALIDERVRPLLRAKFRLGLFDDPYVDPDEAERVVRNRRTATLALEAARETITLLKNANGVLPLDAASDRRPSP